MLCGCIGSVLQEPTRPHLDPATEPLIYDIYDLQHTTHYIRTYFLAPAPCIRRTQYTTAPSLSESLWRRVL